MMTACATSTHLSPTILANLIVPCPELLKHESGQGKEITLWIIDTVAKFNVCSALNDVKNKAFKQGFSLGIILE
ncbi:hypothetical protein [Acinetobacter gerneri]|uniref:Uncharacterized protein n=2 Tax=Acinetobacter gerneri TaxID=202952 RepID=N8YDA6_9GAMM|nr:hypothetical protein [Acinetobacter gerneri]ENV34576.1 hypothetical protein F960_01314 [Acinetobacter gerneri DSM 14967 = CIP 107464 = MTCC 9824]EPR82873.1 hypothetical protein L289_2598 [Acinetobacter gerneri DSM 14967 = CIP 107464 = MTCC 9824]MDQ9009055.1 hypothetical protein [Acinetobacter gerneri]MDQ9013159.1 hypothetical protein [Acinetobacter gerneri]MDQ9024596.1 hypothetical protein [Acinetobacter gerneri]